MAVTVKCQLAYCDQCSPKVAIGWGAFPAAIVPKHVVAGGQPHNGKFMDMDSNEPMNPGETASDFLARMTKKYLKT